MNRVQRFVGFVYTEVALRLNAAGQAELDIKIEPRRGIAARCSRCLSPCPGYDRLEERRWLFVPLWHIPAYLRYRPRRVQCAEHGVVVEHMPWSDGKRPVALAMMDVLAHWARHLSWRETARAFQTSWEAVYRSVEWMVEYGLKHRVLEGVEAIGVDEVFWGKGKRRKRAGSFLTVIYQIDAGCRRLLWVGPRRTKAALREGLAALGPEVVNNIRFVCSDMWKAYLTVLASDVKQAMHVLDRFHIVGHLNGAVDQVRRGESARLKAGGNAEAAALKDMRWKLLRRGSRVLGKARARIKALLNSNADTARAWQLKETFSHFWTYKSVAWASAFLDYWCDLAADSGLDPMKKVARMLRDHKPLIMNWFRAKGELSSGAVEGLNNKIRVVTRRSYGFRTYHALEMALYHNLGRLPEPDLPHRFR